MHECAVLKPSRHVRRANEVWRDGADMQRALMLSRAGQCGIETAKTTNHYVEAVAYMDRPANYSHMDLGESIMDSTAPTLQLHGLPYDYESSASLESQTVCPVYNVALCNPLHPRALHTRVFTWQSHMGRCGGDGKCTQAHEVVKVATKRLALCNPDPGGIAVTSSHILIEPRHLRSDDSRPWDLYVVAGVTMQRMPRWTS